eukprot:4628377-Pyramimonas_sp.AAC.1
MASPTDHLGKTWKPPPSFIPTPRTVTDDSSTSSADDPDVDHAVLAAGDANGEGLAPGRSPCLTPMPSPGT